MLYRREHAIVVGVPGVSSGKQSADQGCPLRSTRRKLTEVVALGLIRNAASAGELCANAGRDLRCIVVIGKRQMSGLAADVGKRGHPTLSKLAFVREVPLRHISRSHVGKQRDPSRIARKERKATGKWI